MLVTIRLIMLPLNMFHHDEDHDLRYIECAIFTRQMTSDSHHTIVCLDLFDMLLVGIAEGYIRYHNV
jgi:hypothetical protein